MNMQELIELLEDCDPEAEVRLAHQPGWPLAFELRGVAAPDDAGYEGDEEAAPEPGVVWLVEGGDPDDSPYARQLPVGHRQGGVTVAYMTHDPTRGEPAITCYFCAHLPPTNDQPGGPAPGRV